MNFKNAIAITGGIATGKSTTCNILRLFGFRRIDADEISKNILDISIDDIASIFGDRYIKNNQIDREALGELIFSDKSQKKRLELLLHPKIKLEIIEQSKKLEQFNRPYLVDIPLFFETNNYNIKTSVLVYASRNLQIKRAISRDKLNENELIKRLDSQLDIEKKKRLATYIIDNSQNLKHLQQECENFIQWIKNNNLY
jgi:dephospho-CoA kinase